MSPNRFLKPEQRVAQDQRVDQRRETLKQHLAQAIKQSNNIRQVKNYMERNGYEVELGRGIAFTDQQHVRFKGSQVGYAMMDIERKLNQELLFKQQQIQQQELQHKKLREQKLQEQRLKQQKLQQQKLQEQQLRQQKQQKQTQDIHYDGGISI